MAAAVRRLDKQATLTQPVVLRGRVGAAFALYLPRLVGAFIVVWGASSLAFLVLHIVPGDPVDIMLGVQSQVSEGVRQNIREELGLTQPVLLQYVGYLGKLVTGEFGMSYRLQKPVIDVIGEQIMPTLQLAGLSIVFAVVLALGISLAARGRVARAVASLVELIAISSPTFWTGLLLLTVFSFQLHWFPISGGQGLNALVLPALTLALPIAGILSQVLRHGLEGTETQPFVDSSRARGLSFSQLLARHTLRHAALPAVTLAAYIVGSLLGGAVIIEQLFGRPGIGRVTLEAINNRDIPIVMAIVIFAALVFVVVNLIVDAVAPLLDPRLRGAR
ncbi:MULTISPECIES: ABC transporter permease [unclassified Microbacterium]|uniref:ABC transporter permease n=1 Tax=unclassified Microbacterium TaxID=2609290 RepID=UPI00214AEE38|nr:MULTISPECIES: ABC transporter permease [unclassified Microbacterium]MCR2811288.1 ABC transporter permease [Microbacterium sp. zg.B185]WIM19446.1 ABC transporter permease [Microbacterium sp. zg-B185]